MNYLLGWDHWQEKMTRKIEIKKTKKEAELIKKQQDMGKSQMSSELIKKKVKEYGIQVNIRLWIFKFLGILITAFGISQGSSFWYDTLRRFIGMRTGLSGDTGKNQKE
jgi:hypothetical protein